jgi:fatty acid desaturase
MPDLQHHRDTNALHPSERRQELLAMHGPDEKIKK